MLNKNIYCYYGDSKCNDFFETAFLFHCDFHDQFDCRVLVNYQIKPIFSHTTILKTEERNSDY